MGYKLIITVANTMNETGTIFWLVW